MEFRWGPDVIRLELAPIEEGGTVLTLLDTLEERGKAARDGAGWHTCLDALERELGDDADAREEMSRWKDVHVHYVESFGPEAATIGPPEGI
jgi:Activator of Hsp90 ATPase homolog 1-like protein